MKTMGLFFVALFWSIIIFPAGEKQAEAAPAKKTPPPAASSCAKCHADWASLLPQGHPAVSGRDIAACFSCHAPDTSGKAEPNPFAARIHRSHEGAKAKVDCIVCHTWAPKKSFGLKGQKISWGAPSKDDMALMKKIFASWVESPYIDSLHARKNVTCSGCHGKALPKEDATVENSRCASCHNLEQLIAKSAPPDSPNRNPHKSHLGDINCSVCHHAHSESKVYCLECHSHFQMKIPGGPSQGQPPQK